MRVALGETCSRFRPGPDGGRDGWFEGQATALLATQGLLDGRFVIQCKHTSLAHEPLQATSLTKELEKVELMARVAPCHYILMTNRQVSANNESTIRLAFEAIPGVGSCRVLGESWIEDTIDAHPRLLRLVPRLYGIGDLSQILSFALAQQTEAVLEDLAHSLRTFVPTDSYRRAERALHEHGFVVLVGPPASGKSAIAANLCMVSLAQDPDVRVLRIEHADQFKTSWSPTDSKTIYWADDVFGETTLDDPRLREWSAALEKIEAARKRRARIVFCTRDYILAAAEQKLKKSKVDLISDARVRVDVTELSPTERDAILYNHIKHGDLAIQQKRGIKPHLSSLARLGSFSPELARRLGNQRFHRGLGYNLKDLGTFFAQPVQHFREIIHGLSASETAALAICLLSGNAVPDPVPDDALSETVLRTYDVTMAQIREALEALEGSLVKRLRHETRQTWQFHHPSMIEALQQELASKSSQLALYLEAAHLAAILRDTTTSTAEPGSRVVFLPETVYPNLCQRLEAATPSELMSVAEYLAERASDQLLVRLNERAPDLIDWALDVAPEPNGTDIAARLGIRLRRVGDGILFDQRRRALVEAAVEEALGETGWSGFLEIEGFEGAFPEFVTTFVKGELASSFASLHRTYDWHSQDLSEMPHVDAAIEGIQSQFRKLSALLKRTAESTGEHRSQLEAIKTILEARILERRSEIEDEEGNWGEPDYDDWKDDRFEERLELEGSRFADVDE